MTLLILFYILTPAVIIWLCRKVRFFGKIGPILILYIIGVIVGNAQLLPEGVLSLQKTLSSAIIPIAIPMILFTLNFRKFPIKSSALILIFGVIAVCITTVAGFLLLREGLGPEGWKVGGLMIGVEVGGTPNLASMQLMLGAPVETYIMLNTSDMIVCFFFFVFLMSFGIKFFRKILPNTGITATGIKATESADAGDMNEANAYIGIFKWKNMRQVIIGLLLAIGVLVVSFVVAAQVEGGFSRSMGEIMEGSSFMVVLILTLTTLGIGASFVPGIRNLEKSYDGGMYLVYIFSLVIASMADIRSLDLHDGLYLLMYVAIVVFGSMVIITLFSKLFRIDADTTVITSIGLINSPPFVPMIAAAMRNKDAIIPGIAVGIGSYAVGNYVGILIARLLKIL